MRVARWCDHQRDQLKEAQVIVRKRIPANVALDGHISLLADLNSINPDLNEFLILI